MFDPFKAHEEFLDEIAALRPISIGVAANRHELEARAEYIERLCKLVANHVEANMADAGASLSTGKIDETDASAIEDAGSDCAGQINKAAWAMEAA